MIWYDCLIFDTGFFSEYAWLVWESSVISFIFIFPSLGIILWLCWRRSVLGLNAAYFWCVLSSIFSCLVLSSIFSCLVLSSIFSCLVFTWLVDFCRLVCGIVLSSLQSQGFKTWRTWSSRWKGRFLFFFLLSTIYMNVYGSYCLEWFKRLLYRIMLHIIYIIFLIPCNCKHWLSHTQDRRFNLTSEPSNFKSFRSSL